ncbi:MAG: hypothetical protein LAT62_03435 [Natronospirillum sp.]|uniref:RSP_7527 family protein n=1 Tax=Natronospirillum sp. TaxID=2812955 RepID=UPI0025CEE701|nr:hypothetical protein [Natronospirillum sp.]MCH8550963.1 hypothetical protein [Natronospirillum sp.]
MSKDFEPNIVVDRFGNLDIMYYEEQARRMRSEAFFDSVKVVGQSVRTALLFLGAVTGRGLTQLGDTLQSLSKVSRQA